MIPPSEKADPDEYDALAEYIADAMAEGYTIEAADFAGRPCSYCGEVIPYDEWPESVVTWDTPVVDPETGEKEPYIQRDYFCSEACRREAKRDVDWIQDTDGRRHDDGDRIHEDNIEAMR